MRRGGAAASAHPVRPVAGGVMRWSTYLMRVTMRPFARAEQALLAGPHVVATSVGLIRRPPQSAPVEWGPRLVDEHLAAGPDEDDPAWLSAADVIVRGAEPLRAVRADFPGCGVAARIHPGQGCAVETFTGWRAWCRSEEEEAVCACASLVHAWLVAGRPLDDLDGACLVLSPHAAVRITEVGHPRSRPAVS